MIINYMGCHRQMNNLNRRLCAWPKCRTVFHPIDEDQFCCSSECESRGSFRFLSKLRKCRMPQCDIMVYGRNVYCCIEHRRLFRDKKRANPIGHQKIWRFKRIKFDDPDPISCNTIQQTSPMKLAQLIDDVLSGNIEYVNI